MCKSGDKGERFASSGFFCPLRYCVHDLVQNKIVNLSLVAHQFVSVLPLSESVFSFGISQIISVRNPPSGDGPNRR